MEDNGKDFLRYMGNKKNNIFLSEIREDELIGDKISFAELG